MSAFMLRRAAAGASISTRRVAAGGYGLKASFSAAVPRLSDSHGHGHGHGHEKVDPAKVNPPQSSMNTLRGKYVAFDDVKSMDDLLPPGGEPGQVPTDYEQATGLERLEILGKIQGVDIFDMRPLDASRRGTFENPIRVKSFGDEQYAGCTGCPADSHSVHWLLMTRAQPVERCPECGGVYQLEYVGPEDDGHGHHDPPRPEVRAKWQAFADFVKPEYRN